MKLKFVKEWQKKMKQFNRITSAVETDLITATFITGGLSITTFARGAGLHLGLHYVELVNSFPFATIITQKSLKVFTVKQEKYDAIKPLLKANYIT